MFLRSGVLVGDSRESRILDLSGAASEGVSMWPPDVSPQVGRFYAPSRGIDAIILGQRFAPDACASLAFLRFCVD